jgi:sortase (surface protein transpeptidase)
MHRSSPARAATPLASLLLALSAAVALGADAPWATATTRTAAPLGPRVAAVEGLTTTSDVPAAPTAPLAFLARAEFPKDLLGWRPVSPPVTTTELAAPAAPKPAAPKPTQKATAAAPKVVWWKQYRGTNHVWMPSLGINRPVYGYACGRTSKLANVVYRWGCGGTNNTYLMGHAYGVFKALHDAYYNGKLRKGMAVVYANANGKVRLYRVKTWRVVDPYQVSWAIADQSVPSMTLQTCIGKNWSLRLLVRLVVADR